MNKKSFPMFFAMFIMFIMANCAQAQPPVGTTPPAQPRRVAGYHGPLIENFTKDTSEFFNYNIRRNGYDYRYYSGVPSLTERGTDVMVMRLDTADVAGAGRGPEISSKEMTYYGTYSARIRVPDVTKAQPNIGAVVGYFTYRMDPVEGLSEIDYEWLIADPEIVYIGTWTGPRGKLQRIGRTINLAKGIIYDTSYRADDDPKNRGKLTGIQNQPEKITPIENYNASARFYIYGFDWYPDRLAWWIIHPETNEKIVLWDYQGTTPKFTGIPSSPTRYLLNFWHTNNWAVETNPNSLEKPYYPFALEIDWMSYKPFTEINNRELEKKKQQ
jgi:hypothetical protein